MKGTSVFIQTQETPNPSTLKFVPQGEVMAQGVYSVASKDEASASPLAQKLWALSGVEGLLFGRDFISVTKTAETEWFSLKPAIIGVIIEHFVTKAPFFYEEASQVKISASEGLEAEGLSDQDEIAQEIRDLIDTRVRPAVAMDGGDIVFERFEEGIVYVSLKGACSGCPSSTATLKSGIETMLKHYIPEVSEVRAL